MRSNRRINAWLASLAAVACLGGFPVATFAQDLVEEVIVTGTRKAGTSPTESLSPVDVIGGEKLTDQASFDLTESLTKLNPALNTQRWPIADGTAIIRPVSLRNLAPDQTLVLMNGTRRHRSALVNLQLAPLGTVNQGAQAVDWATIPAAAIKRIEVLRDGASAQYGSDAIAGVINVILKDASDGASISAQYGEYDEDDGERTSISGNIGLPLTDRGFVSVTGEFSDTDITWRGVAQGDAADVGAFLGEPNPVPLDGLGQRWGDPDVEVTKFVVNAGFDLTDTIELYGFATYMDNETKSDFFYRNPVLPPAAGIAGRSTLITDVNEDFLPDDAPQALVDSIIADGLNPDDYITADGASPSGYVLLNPIFSEFPGGYNPNFGADITDYSFVGGVRGEIMPNLTFDVRGRYAENEVDYTLSESINPSLGRLSPLSFSPGTLTQEESSFNADFVKTFDDLPLNVAFGLEWRNETYEIEEGNPASIDPGPTAAFFGVGSDGFQGFPRESAGDFESDSWATFVDVEYDITDWLSSAVAIRYEDYDDLDEDTTDYKFALRAQVNDRFALRGTVSTGFRTPTPGQVHTLNITTTSDSTGALIPNGTYPVDNPIALALGSKPLKPEESTSYTFGFVAEPLDNVTITLDWYQIEIDDRLALLNNTIGASELQDLIDAGIPNAGLLLGSSANYFVNGFDSEITGIDLAVTSSFDDVLGGSLLVDMRHNWNEQDVSSVQTGTINASRVYDLENQLPEHSSVLTFDYTRNAFDGTLRFNYYDEWSTTGGLFSPGDASDQYDYDSQILVDLEVSYTFLDHYRVTIGGDNIFDEFPEDEKEPVSQFLGVKYALTSPFGFNGAFWYARLTAFM
jgi:iron complex outermembrane receptor protein